MGKLTKQNGEKSNWTLTRLPLFIVSSSPSVAAIIYKKNPVSLLRSDYLFLSVIAISRRNGCIKEAVEGGGHYIFVLSFSWTSI